MLIFWTLQMIIINFIVICNILNRLWTVNYNKSNVYYSQIYACIHIYVLYAFKINVEYIMCIYNVIYIIVHEKFETKKKSFFQFFVIFFSMYTLLKINIACFNAMQ